MKVRKCLALLTAAVAASLTLVSCGSSEPEVSALVCGPFVMEEPVQSYAEEVYTDHPEWQEDDSAVAFTSMSFGSEEADAAAYGASTMKITAMAAAKEIDVMVCDLENAARYARSELFLPLADFLTEEELASLSDRFLTFELADEEGNLNGEYTVPCGLSLTESGKFADIYGDGEYGVFLIANAENRELSEEVFREIAD